MSGVTCFHCCYRSSFLFFYISNSIHYSLPSTYSTCYPLSSTCFRPHRPIIRRSKLYMQPCAWVLSQRPHDKDICRGGEYHRLHVQFRPPDDGSVRPETCRGKRIAGTVCRRKRIVYRVGNKENKMFACPYFTVGFIVTYFIDWTNYQTHSEYYTKSPL